LSLPPPREFGTESRFLIMCVGHARPRD
jgi:hypothetical protein